MKHILIISGILIIIIIIIVSQMGLNENIIKKAFKYALSIYPRSIVENAERIFRLETNHFKSKQFEGTFSAGMEKFSDNFPYGWKTINNIFWEKNPAYKPIGFKKFIENQTGKTKYFLKFPSFLASLLTLCAFLDYYNNNPGRWFSTNPVSQNNYNVSIKKIKPYYTNEIF